jgi:NitT/TauT family transport system permease protein
MTAQLSAEAKTPTTARRRGGRPSRPVVRGPLQVWTLRIALMIVLVVLWQVIGGQSSRLEFFISKPTAVWQSLVTILPTQNFWTDMYYTMYETVVGFVIGAVAGILCGFALAFSITVHRVVDPVMSALNSLPRIALASLFILWFGLGIESKIALIVSLVFFPLFLNAYKGATTIDPDYSLLMHTLRANRLQYVRKVVLPSTAPWVLTGAKLGVAQALGGAVVGEIIAAQHGLGAALNQAAGSFDTGLEFAILLVLIVVAMILNEVFEYFESRISSWR